MNNLSLQELKLLKEFLDNEYNTLSIEAKKENSKITHEQIVECWDKRALIIRLYEMECKNKVYNLWKTNAIRNFK